MKQTAETLRNNSERPRSITDGEIYWEIYNAIAEQRLKPGEKLGQDELGEIFGVSKTRIRPILSQLARQCIVEIKPMKGAFVAFPSVEEARQVNQARQLIEDGIVRAAARQITPEHIAALQQNVEQEKEARLRGQLDVAHRLTGEFHLRVAEIAGNAIAKEIVQGLISRDSLVVAIYQKQQGSGCCSIDAHSALIDAIASGDEELASASMKKHLVEILESLSLDDLTTESSQLNKAFPGLKK